MQTEEGETLSLGKDPCPGEGPMPYYSQFLRQGCGSSCEHPCRPGMLALPILSERDDEQVQLGDKLCQGPEHQVSQISWHPERSPGSSLQDADGLGELRGCTMLWALGASTSQPWCCPALSCPVFAHWGPAALWENSSTWTHGESGWPEGAVPLPAACLPPAPSFCRRRAH